MKNKKELNLISNFLYIVREYWKRKKSILVLSFVQIPLKSISSILVILIPKIIFDSLEHNREFYLVATAILIMSFVITLSNVCKILVDNGLTKETLWLGRFYFYKNINFKVMDMDYENYISPKGKELHEKAIQAISGSLGRTMMGFFPSVIAFFSNILGFLSFTAILIQLNPLIVLLLILTYFFDSLLMLLINKQIQKSKKERSLILKQIRYIIQITRDVGFAKDIRIYTMSGWLKDISNYLSNKNVSLEKKIVLKQGIVLTLEGVLILLRDGIAYAYLISRFLSNDPDKQISIGDFTIYFAAITGFGNWLASVVSNVQSVVSASYSLSDYREFISLPDKINKKSKVTKSDLNNHMDIVLHNVSYSFKNSEKKVLDNINLTIHSGEKVALVGANGSGKTTLVSLICGLLYPNTGSITVSEYDINYYGRDNYYDLFAVLFQNSGLIPASISKNIALSENEEINKEKLMSSIEKAGLLQRINELPQGAETMLVSTVVPEAISLSGGETQRLLLARVIYRDSPILILDEPTAALDPIAEAELYNKYNEISLNKTVLFVSHRLASTQFCDRIILLDNGEIIETGTHEELIELGGKYADMYEKQSCYYKRQGSCEVI